MASRIAFCSCVWGFSVLQCQAVSTCGDPAPPASHHIASVFAQRQQRGSAFRLPASDGSGLCFRFTRCVRIDKVRSMRELFQIKELIPELARGHQVRARALRLMGIEIRCASGSRLNHCAFCRPPHELHHNGDSAADIYSLSSYTERKLSSAVTVPRRFNLAKASCIV